MTANTTNYTIPYPEITDFVKDGATAMENIAERVDDVLFAQVANRNLLYNGAMQIAQRSSVAITGITSTGYYTVDRWSFLLLTLGTWTQTPDTDVPTGQGFRTSLKMTCTTADASPAAGDYAVIRQILEGADLQAIRKGTASARTLTMSFWVKGNKTGNYTVQLFDTDNSRSVSARYTINSLNTWEYKTITIPADTTGAFNNDNGGSLEVRWWLGAGSNFTSGTLATTWGALVDANVAVGQVNLADTVNNYINITGVSLTIGSAQVPFQFKSFGEELAECLRYFWSLPSGQTGIPSLQVSGFGTYVVCPLHVLNPTKMRANPTVTTDPRYTLGGGFNPYVADNNSNLRTITAFGIYGGGLGIQFTHSSTALSNGAIYFGNWGDPNRTLWLDAEL